MKRLINTILKKLKKLQATSLFEKINGFQYYDEHSSTIKGTYAYGGMKKIIKILK